MTTIPNRQPLGIPTGGQFAPDARAEPTIALVRPDTQYKAQLTGSVDLGTVPFGDLPAWPEAMGEPYVSFDFSDGKVQTYVTTGDQTMTYWDSDFDGTTNSTDTGDNPWEDFDEEAQEQALEWGKEVHERIDSATYGIMVDASNTPEVSDLIVAYATGQEPPKPDFTDEEVRKAHVEAAEKRAFQARREMQQMYLIGAALELREKHPEIDSFELTGNGEEPLMEAAWDADGQPIEQTKLSQANHDVFAYRSHDDFDIIIAGGNIGVAEAIAFRPGS